MSGNAVNIQVQRDSTGILYEGYDTEFIQCIFEDGDVQGTNERYEYRCRPNLQCCGRACCVPQEAMVPFWLMVLFIVLALLLLMAILGTIAWLCSKRKRKPKVIKVFQGDRHAALGTSNAGYHSMKQHDDDEEQRQLAALENAYSTPADHLGIDHRAGGMYGRGGRGYGNPMYGLNGGRTNGYRAHDRESGLYAKAESAAEGPSYRSDLVVPLEGTAGAGAGVGGGGSTAGAGGAAGQLNTSGSYRLNDALESQLEGQHGGGTGARPGYYHEKFEEKFEEKYEVQRDEESDESDDDDSRELM